MSDPTVGDSIAAWVDAISGQAVALHFAGREGNAAYVRLLSMVLNSLGLHVQSRSLDLVGE